ncbi:uncharacterized protein LY89DRAFT_505447 [Mollisia scopiformis]|uniref:Uncharacterized protein n=1 Tax=Mollisia scopiformis TaxID=149040 RepID=A0A194XF91_MOLSC|nr:uncharacterized protein LY89DRAFT_505447 [Mollisia scopiformis]KUJ18816.1 hypothetical protein LY89DRAFT_505447 [Mollisia scopiformis]
MEDKEGTRTMLAQVRENFRLLEVASEQLNAFAAFIEAFFLKTTLSNENARNFQNFTYHSRPTVCEIIEIFGAQAQAAGDKADRLESDIQFMKRVMLSEVVSIMQQDLRAVSELRVTLQHVLSQWKLSDLDQIEKGLESANSQGLISICENIANRRHEQRYVLHHFHKVITSGLLSTQLEFDFLSAETSSCTGDQVTYENILRAVDWTRGKVELPDIEPIIKSFLRYSLKAAFEDFAQHRHKLDQFLKKSRIPSLVTDIQKVAASSVVYLGPYPMFKTLNDDIMKLSCIAALSCKKETEEERPKKRLKTTNENDDPKPAVKILIKTTATNKHDATKEISGGPLRLVQKRGIRPEIRTLEIPTKFR